MVNQTLNILEREEFLRSCGVSSLIYLDVGKKKIGAAIGNAGNKIASPLEVIREKNFNNFARVIFSLLEQYEVSHLLVGVPLNDDASDNKQTQSIKQFARNLLKQQKALEIGLKISFYNESYSSREAECLIREMNVNFSKKKEISDSIAAMVVLQSFFDSL